MASAVVIHAVIPCLNEARHIGPVVNGVLAHVPHVVVVDDGSSDDTAMQAAAAGADVLRHPVSLGKGAALIAGIAHAEALGATFALCLDGDGQHLAQDIPVFLDAATRTGAPLIIGNRFADRPRMPLSRRIVNRIMSRLIGTLVRREIPDSQCGFRLLRLDEWRRLRLAPSRFEIESEMIVAGSRLGWRITFVPVHAVYRDETSKIEPVRDGWRWIRWYREAARTPAYGVKH